MGVPEPVAVPVIEADAVQVPVPDPDRVQVPVEVQVTEAVPVGAPVTEAGMDPVSERVCPRTCNDSPRKKITAMRNRILNMTCIC